MGEESLLQWLSDYCAAGALLGCLYTLVAAVLVVRFSRRRSANFVVREPVTLLKPLCGDEPGLLSRLSPFCAQAYDGRVLLVFGTQDRADRAIGVLNSCRPISRTPTSISRSMAAATAAIARFPISPI